MSVFAEFYKDVDMGAPGESFTLDNNWRYRWISFGGTLNNEITSLRATAFEGGAGNVYGFTDKGYLGNYASLNLTPEMVAWYGHVGGALNDDIESALMVNRNPRGEVAIDLGAQIGPAFAAQFDAAAAGTQVSRTAEPRVFTLFWPGHDPGEIFVSIEQDLNVALDWWPDYAAQVRYDVKVYRTADGHLDAYVAWVYTWVEGGLFTGKIADELKPRMVAAAATLTGALRDKLAAFAAIKVADAYLLPGPPAKEYAEIRNARDGSTLVLVW
ncbi:MAG: hypothetical protein K8W52_01030 [Deltaproteobacteria bacterium]|nr:hypothetical protein [Deltaproteobacteria bacterium]